MIIPYIATASQKITDTKFLVTILGDFTEEPNRVAPVTNIPLSKFN